MAIRRKLLLGFAFFTLVCMTVSNYGPVWQKDAFQSVGLWKTCYLANGICVKLSKVTSTHEVVRAFSVLSVLMAFFGTLAAFLSYKTEKTTGVPASLLLLACVLCSIIALAVYTDENGSNIKSTIGLDFGWSFILAWISTGMAFIGMVVGFLTLYQYGY
ncbi:epithelial membrane protein 2-like [Clytia hemisphaerica]|uniref:Uncharacterized protein n=1 Tax=Clytia hemisphaerica TaxID=252671 RepID=A0A7M5XJ67_9CNID